MAAKNHGRKRRRVRLHSRVQIDAGLKELVIDHAPDAITNHQPPGFVHRFERIGYTAPSLCHAAMLGVLSKRYSKPLDNSEAYNARV